MVEGSLQLHVSAIAAIIRLYIAMYNLMMAAMAKTCSC